MNSLKKWLSATVLATLSLTACAEQTQKNESKQVCKNETPASAIRLSAPLMTKGSANMGAPLVADINGDGLQDIIYLNNEEGKIEILYQKKAGEKVTATKISRTKERWDPVFDDAPFRKESISGSMSMMALAVGDMNNDGKKDIIFSSQRDGLVVILNDGGEWKKRWEFDNYSGENVVNYICVKDINDDKKDDLAILTKTKNEINIFIQTDGKTLPKPEKYSTPINANAIFSLIDLNNDGTIDCVFPGDNRQRKLLFLRPGDKTGKFGPATVFSGNWQTMDLDTKIELEKGKTGFAFLNKGKVEIRSIEKNETPLFESNKTNAVPECYSFPSALGNPATQTALIDVNADGFEDIVFADVENAQLGVCLSSQDGSFREPVYSPSYAGISSILLNKRNSEIYVFSQKENLLGTLKLPLGKDTKFTFPKTITLASPIEDKKTEKSSLKDITEEKIVALSSCDDGVVAVYKNTKNNSAKLCFYSNESLTNSNDVKAVTSFVKLDTMRRDPNGIIVGNLGQSAPNAVVLLLKNAPAQIFNIEKKGVLKEVAQKSSLKKSLFDDLTTDRICISKEVFYFNAKGYVRTIRLTKDDDLEIVSQFNNSSNDSVLSSPVFISNDKDKYAVLYDTRADLIELYKEENNNFIFEKKIRINQFAPSKTLHLISAKNEKSPRLLFMGTNGFSVVATENSSVELNANESFESDLKNAKPEVLLVGDFNNDKKNDIVLFDQVNKTIEFFERSTGTWKSVLDFVLFKIDMHSQRWQFSQEPKAGVIGDLNNDKKTDLVLFMHDRILVYLQK